MAARKWDCTIKNRFSLEGRTALVTGAGRGIGRSCALALAEAGAEVWVVSRTEKEIQEVAREIGKAGRAMVLDVTDSAAVREGIRGLDKLDILVNNAGSNIPEPFVDVSEEHLDRLLDLNVRSAFVVAQAAAKKMIESKTAHGAILNMSSQMGHVGAVNRSVYCMTKHALEGLTKVMALELAPHGIRVLSIAPTFVETPLTRTFFAKPEFAKWVGERIPLGNKPGNSDDVASAVVFAASSGAGLMTGSSLLVDGGWTAQ